VRAREALLMLMMVEQRKPPAPCAHPTREQVLTTTVAPALSDGAMPRRMAMASWQRVLNAGIPLARHQLSRGSLRRTKCRNDCPQPLASGRCRFLRGRFRMYGHSHTGIGSIVLTLVALAKGGIGYLVSVIAHAQHAH
jgi:hypothetical protein